jgi:hypothetical protein
VQCQYFDEGKKVLEETYTAETPELSVILESNQSKEHATRAPVQRRVGYRCADTIQPIEGLVPRVTRLSLP